MMLWCLIVGHALVPLRFQPSPDRRTWVYQCRRCGKAETP